MKQVGTMLKEARVAQGLSIADVEKNTRIRAKFLTAIESDDFSSIPSPVYTKGFIKNYSDFLGLNSDEILAFFRRQTMDGGKNAIMPKGMADPLNSPMFTLTPGKFIGILVIALVFLFGLYFAFQYQHLHRPPNIILDEPKNDQVFEERKIQIIGATDPDATVTINGISTIVRPEGKFFDQVLLTPGVNTITITATSRFGKTTTLIRKVGLKQ